MIDQSQRIGMTLPEKLCVKIALLEEQWDTEKLFEETASLLPKYLSPQMNCSPSPVANNPAVAAQQDFLRELSMCQNVERLFQVITTR